MKNKKLLIKRTVLTLLTGGLVGQAVGAALAAGIERENTISGKITTTIGSFICLALVADTAGEKIVNVIYDIID